MEFDDLIKFRNRFRVICLWISLSLESHGSFVNTFGDVLSQKSLSEGGVRHSGGVLGGSGGRAGNPWEIRMVILEDFKGRQRVLGPSMKV